MDNFVKKIIALLMAVILCFTVSFPVSASVIDDYVVFSLSLLSQNKNEVKLAVGLKYESFSTADITVIPTDSNSVCQSIDYTDLFKEVRDSFNDSGAVFMCEKNPQSSKVSIACSDTITKAGDYFIYTFEMPDDKPVTKYDFSVFVDDTNFDLLNLLPDDYSETTRGNFTYITDGYEATIVKCNQYATDTVVVPEDIDGYIVSAVNPFAFYNCTGITEISIPESVSEIGEYAFSRCDSLYNIDFNNCNIKTIKTGTFYSCDLLRNIVIPTEVQTISDYAFAECSSLENVKFNDKLSLIGEGAFLRCSSINVLDIPDSVDKISLHSFDSDSSLKYVFMGKNASEIESFAFYGCINLEKVLFYGNKYHIYNFAFGNCCSLSDVCFSQKSDEITNLKVEEDNGYFDEATTHYQVKYIDDHFYKVYYQEEGSCEFEGISRYRCIDCSKTYVETIPSGHIFSDWKLVKSPTFDDFGEVSRECSRCGEIEVSTLKKVTGDTIVKDNFIIGINPNTAAIKFYNHFNFPGGIMTLAGNYNGNFVTGSVLNINYRSYNLNLKYEVVIFGDVNSDSSVDSTDSVIISCLANGMLTKDDVGDAAYFAADCNHDGKITEDDSVMVNYTSLFNKPINQNNEAEIEHKYEDTVIPPTCTENGYTIHTCSICGNSYKDSFVEATGHKYSNEWTVIQNPTYISVGYKTHCCSICGEKSEVVEIPKLSSIVPKVDGVTIDVEKGIVSGIEPESRSISTFIKTAEYGYKIECSSNIIGTGTKVNIIKDNVIIQSFSVIIFGDVNGDGSCDAMDSVFVSMIVNGMIKPESLSGAIRTAADCNGDGEINNEDIEMLNGSGLGLIEINQKR